MASQEGTSASGGTSARVEPVFFLNTEVKQESGSWLGTLEICMAVRNVVADESVVEGAQRIGGLWRIYLTDEEARVNLLCTGISLRGQQITLRDKNPFLHAGLEGADTTRLFMRNIPLSFDNAEIEKSLKSRGVQMIGSLKYARARTAAGKLTNFKTGDRFVDIIVPKEPLPQKLAMGLFTASLYHKEQKQGQAEIECGNCKQKGHMRRDCKNEAVCYDCLQTGHKKGAESCPEMQKWFRQAEQFERDDDDDDFVDAAEGKKGTDGDRSSESGSECDEDDEEDVEGEDIEGIKGNERSKASTGKEIKKQLSDIRKEVANSGEQRLITQLWGGSSGSSPASSRTIRSNSPARVRRMDDRSPEEAGQEAKQRRKKKAKNTNK